ncbi:glucose-6-phosphate isomerase [Sporosarcina sp. ANT_H38]|uniref:glucose-6-phosphate isomerase n=1 Tax=Sporosarcina sp. ANT_H38 TaxID=2597358 RepID=UPI0011F0CF3C|nr:glucose-6-phosphate isomerase [Sporosarcina sp. ANT_H38]KAA0966918.1 glucose-6-phosphate isomerase [Sporosarcina sp. ANT_H38]
MRVIQRYFGLKLTIHLEGENVELAIPLTLNQTQIAVSVLEELFDTRVKKIHQKMNKGTSEGADYLGWKNYPNELPLHELEETLDAANKLRENAELVVVIGIGGSYLGAKAIQDALSPYFERKSDDPEVIFAGQNLSGAYMKQLLSYMGRKEVAIIVISKSGTTTEPAIAFRILLEFMENRYGSSASERIVAITDKSEGALRELAIRSGFRTFVIPDDIGGRYSVLTPVGLLPLAVAGVDIKQLLAGAKEAVHDLSSENIGSNIAYQYASLRSLLLSEGYNVEILASFSPNFEMFNEWWKQLFGESEGKGGNGIFPAAVAYPTDLHSLGQYVQDGQRMLFETFVHFTEDAEDYAIPSSKADVDGLNYLSDKTVNEINEVMMHGAMEAHKDGGVPVLRLEVAKQDAYHIGYLIYFFQLSCAMSAYLQGQNPFDQPGVEEYKNNIFRLLEKPGYVEAAL